jgi:hypothetical protein
MSFEFCIPTKATSSVPDSPDWLHEVKYDGYRLRLERDGDRVRLPYRRNFVAVTLMTNRPRRSHPKHREKIDVPI